MKLEKKYLLFIFLAFVSFNIQGQNNAPLCNEPDVTNCTSPGILITLRDEAKTEFMIPVTTLNQDDLDDFIDDVKDVLDDQLNDGSWNLDYDDPDDFPGDHLENLALMAQGWQAHNVIQGFSVPNYSQVDIKDQILDGLDFWYCLNPAPVSNNWFDNEIGKQRDLQVISILLSDQNNYLAANLSCDNSTTILNSIIADMPTNNYEPDDNEAYTGANKADIAASIITRGIIANDVSTFEEGRCLMQCAMTYVPEEQSAQHLSTADLYEGIQTDFSFHQHKRLLYSGGYGYSLIHNVSLWGSVFQNTCYEFEEKEHFFDFILEGCRWMIRGNTTDYSASGRYLVRRFPRYNDAIDPLDMDRVIDMASNAPNTSAALSEMKNNSMDGVPQVVRGNRYFRKSDYVSHYADAYLSTIKMCSDRTIGTESVGGQNEDGYWLPYGCTYFYRRGDEYRGFIEDDKYDVIFRHDDFDWKRIPGVTAPKKSISFSSSGTERSTQEGVYFVGATSNGEHGVSTMNLNEQYDDDEYVSGRKAWFHFGSEIIALGADIKSNASESVYTTINQAFLNTDNTPIWRNGQVFTSPAKVETDWIHHDGIAYIFPKAPEVTIRTGDDIFKVYTNHGNDLEDEPGSYQYIVVPGIATDAGANVNTEVTDYINASNVEVLYNNDAVQAVKKDDLAGIVFYPTTPAVFIYNECEIAPLPPSVYSPSSFSTSMSTQVAINNEITLATDKPCALIYENGRVCISSPDRSHSTINLFVITNNGTETTTIPFNLPAGDLQGESTCLDINDPENWGNEETPDICTSIIYDEFDDGEFGNWNDGGSDCSVDDSSRAFSPEECIKIDDDNDDDSSTFSNSLALENAEAVTVEFTFITRNFEANNPDNENPDDHSDQILLEVSLDNGNSFQIVQTWVVEEDFCDKERVFASVCISDINFTNSTVFRIRNDAANDSNTHQAYLDNIEVLSCEHCGIKEAEDCFDIILSSDDAQERNLNVNTTNQTLVFGNNSTVGLRFQTDIPASVEITSAYIEFQSSSDYNPPTIQRIGGVDPAALSTSPPNATFDATIPGNITNRTLFTNMVIWDTEPWQYDYFIQTTDIKELVEAMISSQGYDGTMVFTFTEQGTSGNYMGVRSFDHSAEGNEPKLCITYQNNGSQGEEDSGEENGGRRNGFEDSMKTSNQLLVSIAPNPSKNHFTISFAQALLHDGTAEVYDANGKIQFSTPLSTGQSVININAKDWPTGIYFLKINNENQQTTERLVKF